MAIKIIRGRVCGRPRSLSASEEMTMIRRYLIGGEKAGVLRKEYGISAPTFAEAVKRVRANFNALFLSAQAGTDKAA